MNAPFGHRPHGRGDGRPYPSSPHAPDAPVIDWSDTSDLPPDLRAEIEGWEDGMPPPCPRPKPDDDDALTPTPLASFLATPIPPRRLLLDPILPEGGIAMLYGPRGVGKTHIALGMAVAAAAGAGFLAWRAPRPSRVLYIDGEMPCALLQERFKAALSLTQNPTTAMANLGLLAADERPRGLPDFSAPEGSARYNGAVQGRDLIVLDNISTLCGGAKENDAEGWSALQGWALAQRRAGRTVLFVHHAGKGGDQRGTSRREDVMDTVVKLSRPDDYAAGQGARFRVEYTKGRALFGMDAEPFEAWLKDGQWEVTREPGGQAAEAMRLIGEGLSYRKAAEQLGISPATVARFVARHKERKRMEGMEEG